MANIKDNYTFKEMQHTAQGLKDMYSLAKILGLKDENLEKKFKGNDSLFKQFEEMAQIPDKFNNFFSERGWIAYETLNFDLMKKCVGLAENGKIDEAEEALIEYYTNEDAISIWTSSLMHIKQFRPRRTLTLNALDDHFNGRYYASVPLFLMMIDGFVNDIEQKGFFAEGIDLTVWDTIAAHKSGLQTMSSIFGKGRTKTTDEEITLPYRNGILHGRDLGYANVKVSSKALATLLALSDWAKAVNAGQKGIEKEFVPPTLEESMEQMSTAVEQLQENERARAHMDKWERRKLEIGIDIPEKGEATDYEEDTPERAVVSFLNYLEKNNYGHMADLLSKFQIKGKSKKVLAGELRKIFKGKKLIDYKLEAVKDDAPAISEVFFCLTFEKDGGKRIEHNGKLRLSYEDEKGDIVARGYKKANWKIMIYEVRQLETVGLFSK
ncbi:hypothetical protein [Priestia megaterium]|uniref:hypothetical protein n=1 Tax=Priestia megaterium TaxID=1404 RepID=UPI002E1C99BE|nr:hypothetical protein [Priestia megaterium]